MWEILGLFALVHRAVFAYDEEKSHVWWSGSLEASMCFWRRNVCRLGPTTEVQGIRGIRLSGCMEYCIFCP